MNPALEGRERGHPMQEQEASAGEADVTAIWVVGEPNDLVYAEVLEILFGPDSDDLAA